MEEDDICTDDDGNSYWLDADGDPDFDDPVITLADWLGYFGISSEEASKVQKKILQE